MSAVTFVGESSGARILKYGQGISNVGTNYQFDITTWDIVPATEVGDVVFRSIDVTFTATNGYQIGVTPIVDGVNQPEQTFSGAGTGEFQVQAFLAVRGARLAARVRTLSRSGDLELHDIAASFKIIRLTP